MNVITTIGGGCVLLCVGVLGVLGPAGVADAAGVCMSVEARQADHAQAAAYLTSQGWEPTKAAAVVRKMDGGGRHC